MFGAGADKPGGFCRFDEDAAAGGDYLEGGGAVFGVVGCPDPY